MAFDEPYPAAKVFSAPFEIDANRTTILADQAMTEAVADTLATAGGVVFDNVIAPKLLESLIARAQSADFRQTDLKEFGLRGNDLSPRAGLPFCMVLARPVFMRWLEQISGCPPVAHVEGHLVQMLPGNNLGWHRDAGHGIRRLAMVLNLSTDRYEGGRFELRQKSTTTPMLAYQATTPGSLALFRLSNDLQHQVTQVTAGGPRTTFTGWARGPWIEADRDRDFRLAAWPQFGPPTPDPSSP